MLNVQLIRILNSFMNLQICVTLFDFLIFSRTVLCGLVLFLFHFICLHRIFIFVPYLTLDRIQSSVVVCSACTHESEYPNIQTYSSFQHFQQQQQKQKNDVLRQKDKANKRPSKRKAQSPI